MAECGIGVGMRTLTLNYPLSQRGIRQCDGVKTDGVTGDRMRERELRRAGETRSRAILCINIILIE